MSDPVWPVWLGVAPSTLSSFQAFILMLCHGALSTQTGALTSLTVAYLLCVAREAPGRGGRLQRPRGTRHTRQDTPAPFQRPSFTNPLSTNTSRRPFCSWNRNGVRLVAICSFSSRSSADLPQPNALSRSCYACPSARSPRLLHTLRPSLLLLAALLSSRPLAAFWKRHS